MKNLNYFLIGFILIFQSSSGQTAPKKEIYNQEFKWKITIPEDFENVSAAEWSKIQSKGLDAIENTFDQDIVNHAKTIFVFKSDEFNYFESNHQPFDTATDGDYLKSCKNVNDILYETFKTQMPGIKIDSTRTVERIDNLEFQTFKMEVEYPNKMKMKVLMYSRLFDKKEFSVNIMYVNDKRGEQMLDSWRKSKFAK